MYTGNENIIRLTDLEAGFRERGKLRRTVTGPLNISLPGGEFVALMGKNGSGKSTLLRTLSGLQKPLGGSIYIRGKDLEYYSGRELAKILGYVSTDVVRVQGMQVQQLVTMGRYPHTNWFGSLTPADREKIEYALEITSLNLFRNRDLYELSDGERQRAMIARTLAQDTVILMLDEPTAFLDLSHKFEIIRLLKTLSRDHRRTVLFSTHDLQTALREADKIWLMNRNEIIEGAPEDLVLSGSLRDALLEENSAADVLLDMQSGEFRLDRKTLPGVAVRASDKNLETWTLRAIERMGYRSVRNKQAGISVIAGKEGAKASWIVEKKGQKVVLNSIYELSLYLRTNV